MLVLALLLVLLVVVMVVVVVVVAIVVPNAKTPLSAIPNSHSIPPPTTYHLFILHQIPNTSPPQMPNLQPQIAI